MYQRPSLQFSEDEEKKIESTRNEIELRPEDREKQRKYGSKKGGWH